uniref:Uncharacterized protein n=1 Tax=Arundo donax TaxID=35708 RepID=A0A0A9APW3_ARUDO
MTLFRFDLRIGTMLRGRGTRRRPRPL